MQIRNPRFRSNFRKIDPTNQILIMSVSPNQIVEDDNMSPI